MKPAKGQAEKFRIVVVVDDDEDARESLQKIVERSGWTCLVAANGQEALTILRQHDACVIVADYDMPGMNGAELLQLVATRHPHVCRILLTGRTDTDTAVRAINVGQAWRYLQKPCRSSELLTALHFASEASAAEVENRRLAAQVLRQETLLAEIRRRHPRLLEELETRHPPVS